MDDILSKYLSAKPCTFKVASGRPYSVVVGDIDCGIYMSLETGVGNIVQVENSKVPLFEAVAVLRTIVRGKQFIDLLDAEDRQGHFRTPKQAFKFGLCCSPSPTDINRLLSESSFFTDLEACLNNLGGEFTAKELQSRLLSPYEELYKSEQMLVSCFNFKL